MLNTRQHKTFASAMVALCLVLPLSLAATAEENARQAPELIPYEAEFTASMSKGVTLNGSATRSLTDKGSGVWLYRTDVDSLIADIDESLIFRWEDGRVIPLRYRYRLAGLLIPNREQSIDFDWQAGTAQGQYRGKDFDLELKDGALDPLGYQLQLQQDLKAGKRDVTYQVIDRRRYDKDRFAVIDEENLTSQGSATRTLKAEKVRDKSSKRQTLMWFDPQQDYMLVRLRQVEPDGREYELRLTNATLQN